jgi:CRP-like cAMP-binding protein
LPAKHIVDSLFSENSKALSFLTSQVIFRQGSAADSVFYIQEGRVTLTVISTTGKEAIVAMLGEGDFFGEASLAAQDLRIESATAMTPCRVFRIKKEAMAIALRQEQQLSELFIACLLARSIRYEQDLVDQFFNSSEKRLARILLLLGQFGNDAAPETRIPNTSQGTLAEMVGTTRSRINFFMNKFRTAGFIEYGKYGLRIHTSRLKVILED